MWADFPGCGAALTDRNAYDDEIGAFDGLRIGVDDLIRKAEFHDAPSGFGGARRRHDAADEFLCPRGACDGGTDETHSNQGETPEPGGCHAGLPAGRAETASPSALRQSDRTLPPSPE